MDFSSSFQNARARSPRCLFFSLSLSGSTYYFFQGKLYGRDKSEFDLEKLYFRLLYYSMAASYSSTRVPSTLFFYFFVSPLLFPLIFFYFFFYFPPIQNVELVFFLKAASVRSEKVLRHVLPASLAGRGHRWHLNIWTGVPHFKRIVKEMVLSVGCFFLPVLHKSSTIGPSLSLAERKFQIVPIKRICIAMK